MEKKYKIIYTDPPWAYRVWSNKGEGRSAESHYDTMQELDIASFDINQLADKDSVLLMWATFPCLQQAIDLGVKWGFTYKTVAFTWVKRNKHNLDPFIGMGYYTRGNAEICLLFTKGKPLKRLDRSISQVLISPIGKHSQKPDEFRKRIVRLFGDIPRLEMFARSREGMFSDDEYNGWDVFGNQVNNSINISQNNLASSF